MRIETYCILLPGQWFPLSSLLLLLMKKCFSDQKMKMTIIAVVATAAVVLLASTEVSSQSLVAMECENVTMQ